MAENRRSQAGSAAPSGWVGASPSVVLPGAATPGQSGAATPGQSGAANVGNTGGGFISNRGLLPAGSRVASTGPSGYSPLTSRITGGWTAGRIAPSSGPGQNFGVGLNNPSLGSRSASGQAANSGRVLSGSAYQGGGNLPGFLAGAVNDLNSGVTARTAMQAEWLNRLAGQVGASGDNAYLWAEILRGQGGLNPSGTGGGSQSFGQAIVPGAVARGQGDLLTQQAHAAATRAWIAQNAVARQSMSWDLQKEIGNTQALMGGSPIGTQPYAAQLAQQQSAWQNNMNASQQMANTVAALSPNQRNIMNSVAGPGQSFGAMPYTPIPYVALPY